MSKASDAASVAADSIAWAIMATPSHSYALTMREKEALARKAERLIEHYRNDAESDPNTFAQDLFRSLSEIMDEYTLDVIQAEKDPFR